ncbi:MAG: type II secretion system protein GspG [Deltaproteobacteria bacterium]|nr:type II secretion system protein GspG [Deltaproteobacteria bacterium]
MRGLIKEILKRRDTVSLNERGMTLLEIMVVIAIIGIVATAIGVGVVGYLSKAKVDACKAQIRNISQAVEIYSAENDYPSALDVLAQGADAPLKLKQLKDPWKEDFLYSYPSQKGDRKYDLCSKGPDKREGTEDDVCND